MLEQVRAKVMVKYNSYLYSDHRILTYFLWSIRRTSHRAILLHPMDFSVEQFFRRLQLKMKSIPRCTFAYKYHLQNRWQRRRDQQLTHCRHQHHFRSWIQRSKRCLQSIPNIQKRFLLLAKKIIFLKNCHFEFIKFRLLWKS